MHLYTLCKLCKIGKFMKIMHLHVKNLPLLNKQGTRDRYTY